MAIITKRPSPGHGPPTRLRQRERRRELQRPAGRRQAQTQNPTIQSDAYPNGGEPNAAQIQASAPELPDPMAALVRPDNTKTRIQAIKRQVVPRHLTQTKATRRQAEIEAGSRLMEAQKTASQWIAVEMQAETGAKAMRAQEQAAQTHRPQNSFTEDEARKLHEQKIKDMNAAYLDYRNRRRNDTTSQITPKSPPGPKPILDGSQLPQPSIQMHASDSFIDLVGGMRRYQPQRKGHHQDPQKQRAKEFSVVPTISKDHTAGEQALQADLLAKLGRGKERLQSRMPAGREQHIQFNQGLQQAPNPSFNAMLASMSPENRQQMSEMPPEKVQEIRRSWQMARREQLDPTPYNNSKKNSYEQTALKQQMREQARTLKRSMRSLQARFEREYGKRDR